MFLLVALIFLGVEAKGCNKEDTTILVTASAENGFVWFHAESPIDSVQIQNIIQTKTLKSQEISSRDGFLDLSFLPKSIYYILFFPKGEPPKKQKLFLHNFLSQ